LLRIWLSHPCVTATDCLKMQFLEYPIYSEICKSNHSLRLRNLSCITPLYFAKSYSNVAYNLGEREREREVTETLLDISSSSLDGGSCSRDYLARLDFTHNKNESKYICMKTVLPCIDSLTKFLHCISLIHKVPHRAVAKIAPLHYVCPCIKITQLCVTNNWGKFA